jgi:hypothetical protein
MWKRAMLISTPCAAISTAAAMLIWRKSTEILQWVFPGGLTITVIFIAVLVSILVTEGDYYVKPGSDGK